jgi:HlyD family secretion protein
MKDFYKNHKIMVILFGIFFILLVIVFTSIILLNSPTENKEIEFSTVSIKEQPDDIFKGVVEPERIDKYMLDPSFGDLSEINVINGQEVKQGDTILTYTQMLDHSDVDLTSLTFAITSAKQNLTNATQDLADIQTKDLELRAELSKVNEDEKAEINSKIEANNELWKTAAREVQSAQIALDEANANYINAENKVSQASKINVVKSKSSGIAAVSDTNSESVPLVQIISTNTKITAQLSEFDFECITVGTKVSVEPVNSDQKEIGTVTSISPVPLAKTNDSNTTYYEFTVKLDHKLQNGFNVHVHLKKDGYIVPKSAVQNNQVQLKKGDTFIKTRVQTENVKGKILVKSGLKKGDKIAENFEDIK